jgi:hypothetical protein
MAYQSDEKRPLHILGSKLRPSAIADTVATIALKSPIGFLMVCLVGPVIIFSGGHGYMAVMNWSVWIGLLVALIALSGQIAMKGQISVRRHGIWMSFWAACFFLLCTAANIVFTAGGLAALKPDQLGRMFVERKLTPKLDQVSSAVSQLNQFSAATDLNAKYSQERSDQETGTAAAGYAPTCKGSAGAGSGEFNALRVEDAVLLGALANTTREQAEIANGAVKAAKLAVQKYQAPNHAATMVEIEKQVDIASTALRNSNVGSKISILKARLKQIDEGLPTKEFGLVKCADPILARNLTSAIYVSLPDGKQIERSEPAIPAPFVPPPPPSERESVFGLLAELLRMFSGQSFDLSAWQTDLIFAPFIDMLLLFALAKIARETGPTPLPNRRQIDEILAYEIGGGITPEEVQGCRARAARSPLYLSLTGHVLQMQRRFSVTQALILPEFPWDSGDQELLLRAEDWARLRYSNDCGVIGADQLPIGQKGIAVPLSGAVRVFVLKPGFVTMLLDELTLAEARQRSTDRQPAREAATQRPQASNDETLTAEVI